MSRRSVSQDDERYLRRCLDLARRAAGATSPNPMVGALVVKRGRVLAQAFHRRPGSPHAEAAALRRAGRGSRGATLYVNLEPCCHYGRTPPCVDAIIASGVRRVVASHRDPFPRVAGRGFSALRRAGIQVVVGPLRDEAMRLNECYLTFVTRGRPFVTVKAAMSLDGRIATSIGESRWISSPRSRASVHRMRAVSDAVMVGIGTVLADDPLLTARVGPAGRQPVRVVIDGLLRLPPTARILRSLRRGEGGPVLVFAGRRAPSARAARLGSLGAEVYSLPGPASSVSLSAVMTELASRGVTSLLIEGGGGLIGAALEAGVVDKICWFVAPLVIGGAGAIPVVGGRGAARLRDAIGIERMTVRWSGPDLVVEGYVTGGSG